MKQKSVVTPTVNIDELKEIVAAIRAADDDAVRQIQSVIDKNQVEINELERQRAVYSTRNYWIERSLKAYQKQIADLKRDQTFIRRRSSKNIMWTLSQLKGYAKLWLHDGVVKAQTDAVIIKYDSVRYNIGRFIVSIKPQVVSISRDDRIVYLSSMSRLSLENLDTPQGMSMHPHWTQGDHNCLGSWVGPMQAALQDNDIPAILDIMRAFLSAYNPRSVLARLESYFQWAKMP